VGASVSRYNRHTIKVQTPPSGYAVSVAEMEAYLVLTPGQDTALLQSLILAATDFMQEYLGRSLQTQTLRLVKDGFAEFADDNLLRLGPGVHTGSVPFILGGGNYLDLPRGPVQSVTSITTFDRANQPTVFSASAYGVDTAGDRIYLNEGRVWPDNLRDFAAVQVDYVAGYTTIPAAILQGLKQHIAAMYECRGACEMPQAVQRIVMPYRRVDELGWR
jgi:hypothetical protein